MLTPDPAETPTETPDGAPASRFRAPDTTLVVFGVIVLAAVLTWLVPPGAFERTTIEVPGVGTREVVVPGSFAPVEREGGSMLGRLGHTAGMVLKAPLLGFIHPDAAPIIAFVLFIGGAFAVLTATGAIDAGLRGLAARAERSERLRVALIPLFMTVFSLGGAVFGMAEETIPFILIFVPLALALGYDTVTGVAIPFVGSQAGFAAAFLNPFTVGVAQGIAGVAPFSGMGFRIGLWVVVTTVAVAFVMRHALRVRRVPARSPTGALDARRRAEATQHADALAGGTLTSRQLAVLGIFALGLVALVVGVTQLGWYIVEIGALFIALGMLMGAVGGLGANGTARAMMDGLRDLAPTAALIGLARGILVVLEDGQTVDPVLNALAGTLSGAGPTVGAGAMFAVQTALNFFVPSGSGQAALTMPLMAPLADLLGLSRQTAVLAFQMGDGFTNLIVPTSAVLMGALSLAGVPWPTWARWIVPLQAVLFVLGLAALALAVAIGYA